VKVSFLRKDGDLPTYPQNKVRRCLEDMGATFIARGGRKHATVKYGNKTTRWPNPHDDPIDRPLLNLILKQLNISFDDFLTHYK
jgi:hypothetical protein